jgi:Ca2+-binding EF-hand superfamily protein
MNTSSTAVASADLRLNEADVDKLWKAFSVFDTDQSGTISVEELRAVMQSLGQTPSATELRDLMNEVDLDRSGSMDFQEFKTLMTAQHGDHKARLKLAFDIFDKDGSGRITAAEMGSVMSQVGLTAPELDEMIKEVDEDGNGAIDFAEFCELAPGAPVSGQAGSALRTTGTSEPLGSPAATAAAIAGATAERAQAHPAPVPTSVPAPASAPVPAPVPIPDAAPATVDVELARLRDQLARHAHEDKVRGTSTLQFQTGLFRLIQGAAYRSFRESFSANHETHLRVRSLPYRITDFVEFVRTAMSLYKALGVVDPVCNPMIDAVVASIDAEYARLQHRIANWQTIPKTPEMLAEHEAMVEARGRSANAREKFAAGIEFAITMQKQRLSLADVVEGVLAVHELNRLREEELKQDQAPPAAPPAGDPKAYLTRWNRVLLDNALEAVDGAMMPVAYFYEDFMPKLLTAFTVSTAGHVAICVALDDKMLSGWFKWMQEEGDFKTYGADVQAAFPACSPAEKLRLLQGWWLSRHYLNGVQKQRERAEFGRDSGGLSQYISFIDVYLGRNDIRDAQMRISFPYYIGPAVWRFLHTTAEIVCEKPAAEQQALVATFKQFFKLFATMYPCPYCRHHLNAYVVQNKEVDMYPVEYLLLGHDPESVSFQMSLGDKLTTVSDGPSLRMFLWKLHNTVSSSIARSEEWYHRDDNAFYTTRYWPSLAAELARAKAFGQRSISVERIESNYQLLRPVGRLAGVRLELQRLMAKTDAASLQEAQKIAQDYIALLEKSVLNGRFLQDNYRFDPTLSDPINPTFSGEEEALSRSGLYTEI